METLNGKINSIQHILSLEYDNNIEDAIKALEDLKNNFDVIENGKHPLLDAFISDCKTMPLDTVRNFLSDNGYIILRKKDETKDENCA